MCTETHLKGLSVMMPRFRSALLNDFFAVFETGAAEIAVICDCWARV